MPSRYGGRRHELLDGLGRRRRAEQEALRQRAALALQERALGLRLDALGHGGAAQSARELEDGGDDGRGVRALGTPRMNQRSIFSVDTGSSPSRDRDE